MKKVEKNIHDGHRARLVDLATNVGVDAMSDVQVVEFFLTYIFPRGDVNPLAHRLLNKFETFNQIVEADINDLMTVDGINERSAKKIKLFKDLFFYFTTAKMGKKFVVNCKADIISVVEDCLRFRTTENMILLAISAGNIITHRRNISANSSGHVETSVMEVTNFLASTKPAHLVVAHCHPYGKAMPSDTDGKGFSTIKQICFTCGVDLIDSYIVGEDGVFSQRDDKMVRTYYDVEQLKTVFKNIVE